MAFSATVPASVLSAINSLRLETAENLEVYASASPLTAPVAREAAALATQISIAPEATETSSPALSSLAAKSASHAAALISRSKKALVKAWSTHLSRGKQTTARMFAGNPIPAIVCGGEILFDPRVEVEKPARSSFIVHRVRFEADGEENDPYRPMRVLAIAQKLMMERRGCR